MDSINWRVLLYVVLVAFVTGAAFLAVSEMRAIRKAGGLKKWVLDVPTVNYRTVRSIWLTEAVVVILTGLVIARAMWPRVVADVQVELVYAIFAMLGVNQGMNVTAFIGKRATANPSVIAANAAAADPNALPAVDMTTTTTSESASGAMKTKTTETTVNPVPAPDGQDPEPPSTAPERYAPPVRTAARPMERDD